VAAILKITGDWQKFRGEPGAEGTLRTAEPKRDKLDAFNEALKDAAKEPKGAAVTKKTAKKAGKYEAEAPKAEEPKTEAPKAEAPKAEEPKTEEPKAEEPKAEEPTTEEPKPEVPASETPEGAAEQAEATEQVTAEDAGKSEA
jgi:small subunit ribosomal protein S16